jgi:hypothetical protein
VRACDVEGRAHRGEEMQRGVKWQAERARRGVREIYMLAVISVQSRLTGNDSSTGAARWGRRHGLSLVMQTRGSGVCYIVRG